MFCRKIWCALLTAVLTVLVVPAAAVETEPGADTSQRRPGEPRRREGGRPQRADAAVPRDRNRQEGTEEGMPAVRPDVVPERDRFRPRPRWRLGVHAYNTSVGVVISRVLPGTPARNVGLERGDVIVTVDGYQVGFVNNRIYFLGEELQRQAGRDGRVRLLVQNWRNGRLLNLDARLARWPHQRQFGDQRGEEEPGAAAPAIPRRPDDQR